MISSFRKILLNKRKSLIRVESITIQLIRMFIILIILLSAHTFAMIKFEGMAFSDAIWLTMTSATTVGYGDLSAQTLSGRIATIILLYIGGIAILAQVAAMYFEQRQDIRERKLKGDWSWSMENHIVFLGNMEEVGENYFYQAISGLRNSSSELSEVPIIIVCNKFKDGLSDRLRKLNVVHVSKPLDDQETLNSASVKYADTIVILSKNQNDSLSDSISFELVDRLREMGVKGRIIVEAVKDENRKRLKKVGADNVLRPIRAYPELLMRAIIAPGVEQVIETLFDSYGEECIRYEVKIKSKWINVITKLVSEDLGIAIAYEDNQGHIINNPSAKDDVDTNAIFVIVNDGYKQDCNYIEDLLKA